MVFFFTTSNSVVLINSNNIVKIKTNKDSHGYSKHQTWDKTTNNMSPVHTCHAYFYILKPDTNLIHMYIWTTHKQSYFDLPGKCDMTFRILLIQWLGLYNDVTFFCNGICTSSLTSYIIYYITFYLFLLKLMKKTLDIISKMTILK